MSTSNTTQKYFAECNRCLRCAKPSCMASCPIGNDIPKFMQFVKTGDIVAAVDTIGHSFGEICGYVCPHEKQCQGNCVLGKRGQAIAMGEVERAVFAEHPYEVKRKGNAASNLKVAVVGGGVSGLTFAVKMYQQGANVTIYEKDQLLSTLKLIPDFRLPREAITRILREIDGKLTVVHQSVSAFDLAQIQRDFDIVYVSTGASILYKLGAAGEDFATPYDVFLKNPPNSGDVIVIGGGNTAMDCARVAKRKGCRVRVAYRRTREDMPAFSKEIDDAYNDGVDFVYNVVPVKIEERFGKLRLTLAKTVSEGHGKFTVTDEITVIECDAVVAALGSMFDKSIFDAVGSISDDPRHPCDNIYVGGDAVGGKIVAKAVADALQTVNEIFKKYSN